MLMTFCLGLVVRSDVTREIKPMPPGLFELVAALIDFLAAAFRLLVAILDALEGK